MTDTDRARLAAILAFVLGFVLVGVGILSPAGIAILAGLGGALIIAGVFWVRLILINWGFYMRPPNPPLRERLNRGSHKIR